MCKNYKWGEMFSDEERTIEKTLAQKYESSVLMKEDLHIQDQKFWDYHHHVITLRKANGTLFDKLHKIHSDQRSLEDD